jgi:hypothetical protein
MALSFASFLGPFALLGWIRFRRHLGSHLAFALAGITLTHFLFLARYNVADQFTFLLPSLIMVAVAAGVGIAELAALPAHRRQGLVVACALSIGLPPLLYGVTPSLLRSAGVDLAERQRFRDELSYWITPWKHNEDSAERFAHAALTQASPGSLVLTDSTGYNPLVLVQLRDGLGPDVEVRVLGGHVPRYSEDPEGFWAAVGSRDLFLAKSPAPELAAAGQFERGDGQALYRLVRPTAFAPSSPGEPETRKPEQPDPGAYNSEQPDPKTYNSLESMR